MQTIFQAVKTLYQHHFITKEQVAYYVTIGAISPAEYEMITGEPYAG